MQEVDIRRLSERARHETLRWLLLLTLNIARPNEAGLGMLRSVMVGVYKDATELEVRRELDYLLARNLISLRTDQLGAVFARLERYGMDVVEYMVDCEPGIARPQAGV
jgi:hypothetical protein